jgi:hypothetical protein
LQFNEGDAMKRKRFGTSGVVVTFLTAATTALAGCCTSWYHPSVQQVIAQQAPGTYPAAASQEDPHACAVYTPEWPYSVPD